MVKVKVVPLRGELIIGSFSLLLKALGITYVHMILVMIYQLFVNLL